MDIICELLVTVKLMACGRVCRTWPWTIDNVLQSPLQCALQPCLANVLPFSKTAVTCQGSPGEYSDPIAIGIKDAHILTM